MNRKQLEYMDIESLLIRQLELKEWLYKTYPYRERTTTEEFQRARDTNNELKLIESVLSRKKDAETEIKEKYRGVKK